MAQEHTRRKGIKIRRGLCRPFTIFQKLGFRNSQKRSIIDLFFDPLETANAQLRAESRVIFLAFFYGITAFLV
jgi:hypothetical protein